MDKRNADLVSEILATIMKNKKLGTRQNIIEFYQISDIYF